jgi:hypothetical protein
MRSGLALAGHCRIAILGHRRAGVGFFLEVWFLGPPRGGGGGFLPGG